MVKTPRIAVAWPKGDYLAALEDAGATPRVIDPAQDTASSVLDECDGLLLTGGADVDPKYYGDTDRHPTIKVDPARDEYELALTREALARDMPIFAICRGVQLLNVAAGGTLIQDLPSQHPSSVTHRMKDPPDPKVHAVSVEPGSRLAGLLGAAAADPLAVNSRHHQAVRQVAPGFVVSATAPDGVVEGIEAPTLRFCVGVQWHPEDYWRTGDFRPLFTGFVRASRER